MGEDQSNKPEATSGPSPDVANNPLAITTAPNTNKKRPAVSKRLLGLIVIGVLAVAVLAGLIIFARNATHKQTPSKAMDSVKIGDITITKADVDAYAAALDAYSKANPEVEKKGASRDVAINELVLNAALKYDAKKHGISVDKSEIQKQLAPTGVDSSIVIVEPVDPGPEAKFTRVRAENAVYKRKLERTILARKKLFGILLTYDTVYFNTMPKDQAEAAENKAFADMKAKFMPAFDQKKSSEDIAKMADINSLVSTDFDYAKFKNQGYTIAKYLPNYVNDGTYFNDISNTEEILGREIGDLVDTDTKVDELKNVGDYTQPFASQNGAYMILRLEDKTDGNFNNWDDYLNSYKKEYVQNKLAFAPVQTQDSSGDKLKNGAVAVADKVVSTVSSVGLGHAAAVTCTGHHIVWHFSAYDKNGNGISGAQVSGYRKAHDCSDGITGTATINSGGQIGDNCNGPAITWSVSKIPTGWKQVSFTQDSWPGSNSDQNLQITLILERDDTPPSGSMSASCSTINWSSTDPNGTPRVLIYIDGGTYGGYRGASGSVAFPYIDTSSHWVEVHIENQGGAGAYGVVASPGRVTVGPCDRAPSLSLSANCSTISGTASDPDRAGAINVRITVGGYSTVVSANSSFSIAYPTSEQDTNGRTVTATADGVYPNGSTAGGDTTRSVSVAACDHVPSLSLSANCSTISGTASDPDRAGAINVRITVGGYSTVVSANSSFSIAYPTSEQTNVAHTVTATADGVKPNGDTSGADSSSSVSVGACYIASCNSSSANNGAPITATQGFTTTAVFSNSGPLPWPNGAVSSQATYNGVTSSPGVPSTPSGGRASMTYGTFATPATLNTQSVTMQLLLNGSTVLAQCTTSFDPYTDFTLTPTADSVTLLPDQEDPSSAQFTSHVDATYAQVPGAGIGISGPIASRTITKNGGAYAGPYTNNGVYPRSFVDSAAIAAAGRAFGDKYCGSISMNYTTGKVNRNGTVINLGGGGSSGGQCESIADKPYMRIYGGDVLAGAGFASTDGSGNEVCTANSSASHIGYERVTAGKYYGSGNQLAAYALGQITEFATSSLRSGSNPLPPKGLSFANDNGSNYGGVFGDLSSNCIPDMFSGKPASATVLPNNSTVNGHTVPAGATETVYVDGNVFITGDITYANSNAFSSVTNIPTFRLVARGNIYVLPNVQQLDGVYIAQPTAANPTTTGRFYTCATQDATPVPTSSELIDSTTGCGAKKLTINGSVISQLIKPLRTVGTLRNAPDYEPYASANISEAILFTPEVWLKPGLPNSRSSSNAQTYDAYTTLSPVL